MSPIWSRIGLRAKVLRIPYTSVKFPPSYEVRSGDLNSTWNDLLWSAITIGRPNTAYVFQHGDASLYEALFRLSLVRMALEQRPFDDRLHRTDAFRALDPTEKGAISYFIGMAICKLFSSQLLNAPWLLHLDVFRDRLNPATLSGRSRPDLVGEDSAGRWHAFETKGRSSVPSSEDKTKAKGQASRLVSVNGTRCSLHVGSFAYFRQDELEFYWRDPEPEEQAPIECKVADADWAYYYAPAIALAERASPTSPLSEHAPIDLEVKIHPKLRDPLLEGRWSEARMLAKELRAILKLDGFQPDGLAVTAGESWRHRFRELGPQG